MTISNDSIVVAVKSQVSREVDAMVVLHFDKGLYFGLNVIWNLLSSLERCKKFVTGILREYEVSNEQCERELLTLLGETLRKWLASIRDAKAT